MLCRDRSEYHLIIVSWSDSAVEEIGIAVAYCVFVLPHLDCRRVRHRAFGGRNFHESDDMSLPAATCHKDEDV